MKIKRYEQRVLVSFVVVVPEHVDPNEAAEKLSAMIRKSFPGALNVTCKGQWRGQVVRK